MSKPLRTVLILIVGALAVAGVLAAIWMMSPPPPDLDVSREKATAKGLYSVAIAPEAGAEPAEGELHSWLVTLKTAAGRPVDDAKIEVSGGMPQHGHGLATRPEVTAYLDQGVYRMEGMKFTMSGWWELKLAISAGAGADEAVFNIVR